MRPEANHSRRGSGARPFIMLLATAGLLVTLFATSAGSAQAQGSGTQDWLNRINALRASKGLNALILDANLSDLAQQRAQINASSNSLVHTANLSIGVTSSWTKLAENIGAGQDHDGLWNAFVNSPSHYENLVDPAFTHVGIGEVVVGPHNVWVTHRFMRAGAPAPAGNPTTAAPAATSTPVYVTPTVPAPNRATTSRSTGPTNGGATAAPSATPAPSTAVAADPAATPAAGATVSRSPEHVAAVVNVLSALEK